MFFFCNKGLFLHYSTGRMVTPPYSKNIIHRIHCRVYKQSIQNYKLQRIGYYFSLPFIKGWTGLFDFTSPDTKHFLHRRTQAHTPLCLALDGSKVHPDHHTADLRQCFSALLTWHRMRFTQGSPCVDVASHLHKGLWCAQTAPERTGEQSHPNHLTTDLCYRSLLMQCLRNTEC